MKKQSLSPTRLKRKHTLLSALRTIAYFVGFPLLILAIGIGSIEFMNFDPFQATWSWGIILAFAIWIVCGIVQLVMGGVVRGANSQMIKTIVVAILAMACILGSALYIDTTGAAMIKDINAKYAAEEKDGEVVAKTISIPTYRFADGKSETITWTIEENPSFQTIDYLKGHYVTITTDFDSELDYYKESVEEFCRIYNVKELGDFKKKSTDENGKQYVVNSDFSRSYLDVGTGLPVNGNGLVSESYVYSMDFALNVLINYNEAVKALAALDLDMHDYVAQGSDEMAEEYEARLAAMSDADKMEAVYAHELKKVRNSAEYADYKETDEYQAAYGDNGSAYDFMLSLDRVEEMLPVIIKYVVFLLRQNQWLSNTIYGALDGFIKLADYDEYGQISEDSLLFALSKDGDVFDNVVAWLDNNTELQDIVSMVGMDWEEVRAMISKEAVKDLINDYFYYYSPSVRPDFDFFGTAKEGERLIGEITVGSGEDAKTFSVEQMRAFAFARYYAKINGAYIGSVLVPNNDVGIGALTNGNGHIGMITLSSSGYDASFAYDLAKCYQLKADNEYIPTLFPMLAARRYLYIFAGLVVLSIVLFYQFGRREEEVMAEMLTYCQQEGGADNEE